MNSVDIFVLQSAWIHSNGFKGAMILSLNVDDWADTCGRNRTFPLTRTISKIFNKLNNQQISGKS